jgi:hypothetical protein
MMLLEQRYPGRCVGNMSTYDGGGRFAAWVMADYCAEAGAAQVQAARLMVTGARRRVFLVAARLRTCRISAMRNGRVFERAELCEKKDGDPRRVYRSKFEISAALLQLYLCTACQVGPDHQVMKGPDRVEIGEA